jgi:hypothetical protein
VLGEYAGRKGGDSLGEQIGGEVLGEHAGKKDGDSLGKQIGGKVLGENAEKKGGDSLGEQIGGGVLGELLAIDYRRDRLGGDSLGDGAKRVLFRLGRPSILVRTVSRVLPYIGAVFGAV